MNLLRRWRKKRFFKDMLRATEQKLFNLEFNKRQLQEIKEGMRQQHDRIKEKVDAAQRRLFAEKYNVFYSATGDKVEVSTITLVPRDLEALPEQPTEPHRFHKVAKEDPDKTICANLEKFIARYAPDVEYLVKQMAEADAKIEGKEGLNEHMEGTHAYMGLLKNYMKTI